MTPAAHEQPDALVPRSRSREIVELTEQTQVGAFYLRALMRRQMRLSLTIGGLFALLLGLQPIIPLLWAGYGSAKVLGIPLPWVILGVVSYPLLVALGIVYVRHAESIDDEFTDVLR